MYARDHALIATPIGCVRIEGNAEVITAIRIGVPEQAKRADSQAVGDAAEQLEQWLAGERQSFDLRLAIPATHRSAVLREGLLAVAYGTTQSYGELARALNSSPRAIGQLCARNPFPIVVPCHRILGSGGALGAYSAGEGPTTKSWLLAHERRHAKGTLL